MREEFIRDDWYKDLEPYMDELEKNGVWEKVLRKIIPGYFYEKQGLLYIYRKC